MRAAQRVRTSDGRGPPAFAPVISFGLFITEFKLCPYPNDYLDRVGSSPLTRVANIASPDAFFRQFDFLFRHFEEFAQLGSAFLRQERGFGPRSLQSLRDGVLSREAFRRTTHSHPSDFML